MQFVNDSDFSDLVEESLLTIPDSIREKIDNVSIVVADMPTVDQLKTVNAGMLLGLYQGVPKIKGGGYFTKLPDKITLFKFPLLQISRDFVMLKQNIRKTVIHEVAHHFGMNEIEVRRAEGKNRI